MTRIQNIEIRFTGSANFAAVTKEVTALQNAMRSMQAEMAKSYGVGTGFPGSASADMAKYNQALSSIRDGFISAAKETGNWEAVQVRSTSATEQFNKKIMEQKLTLGELIKSRELYNKSLQQQIALQNSVVVRDKNQPSFGSQSAQLLVPKNLSSDLATAEQRYGYLNKAIKSASEQTINWGKNTQWAGRQLTAGFTMPVVIAAAAVGKLAYDMEAQMTHITKIYEYSSKNTAAQAQEEAALRANSMNLVKTSAQQYGASMNDVLTVEAQFAATGKTGNDLMQSTQAVVRGTTLTFQGAAASAQDYQDVFKATIALQNIYHESAGKVNDQINYLNVVESQTSLRMKDVIDAIPRALGPLKDLGMSFSQFTVALVAMKQNGVPAAQGANALKSAAAGLLNLSPNKVTAFRALNIDIKDLVNQANGNVFDVLTKLSEKKKALTDPKDQLQMERALSLLFGKQQFARLTGVVDSLGQIHDKTTQVGRAYAVAGLSAEDMANKSDQQLKRLREGLSGQLKVAIATLKADLASVGDTVLPIFTGLVNGVAGVIKAFDNLDPGVKKFLLLAVGIGALIGPIVMMAGLFANWIGNISKAGMAIAGFRNKFKMMDPETRVQTELNDALTSSFDGESRAVGALGLSIQALTDSLRGLYNIQKTDLANKTFGVMLDEMTGIGTMENRTIVPNQNGGYYYGKGSISPTTGKKIGGQLISAVDRAAMENRVQATKDTAVAEAEVAAQEEKSLGLTSRIHNNIGLIAMGVGTIGSMFTANNQTTTAWLGILTTVGMAMQFLPMSKIISGITSVFNVSKTLTTVWNGLKNVWAAIGWEGLAIGVAIAGVIFLANKYNDVMTQTKAKQDAINNSAKGWADILGYTYQQQAEIAGSSTGGKSALNITPEDVSLVKAFSDKEKEVVDGIKNAQTEQEKLNLAIAEGIKVVSSGGNATQAYTAVRTALIAAGAANETTINDMMMKVKAQIDFGDAGSIANQLTSLLQVAMDSASKNVSSKGFWESFFSGFGLGSDASQMTLANIDDVAAKFAIQVRGLKNNRDVSAAYKDLAQSFNNSFQSAFTDAMKDPATRDQLNTLGAHNAGDLGTAKESYDNGTLTGAKATAFMQLMGNDKILAMIDAQKQLATDLALNEPALAAQADNFQTIGQVAGYAGHALTSVNDAQTAYNDRINEMTQKGLVLNDAQKLTILNQERLAAGLDATTNIADGFNVAVTQIAGSLNTAAAASNDFVAASATDLVNSLKSTMTGTMNEVYSQADALLTEHNKSVTDGIQKNGDAQVKAIEDQGKKEVAAADANIKKVTAQQATEDKKLADRQKDIYTATKKAFDNKTKALQDQLKDEQAADKVRQKLFDNELARIKRLAAAYDTNINFNAALNSGNLDEAAKISNDAQAQYVTDNITNTKQAAADATKARQDAMQAEIDANNSVRDAALQALQDRQDAEKQALKDRHAAALQALQDAKTLLNDQISADKTAQQDMTKNKIAEVQKQQAAAKQALDDQMLALKATVPQTKAQLDSLIGQVEQAYGGLGVKLKDSSGHWSAMIGADLQAHVNEAAASLKDGVKWSTLSKNITDQMAGQFGLSGAQLVSWLQTGVFPSSTGAAGGGGAGGGGGGRKAPRVASGNFGGGGITRHSGGMVNPLWSQHDRVGITRSNSLHHSEVPTVLKRGEFVMNEHAVARLGVNTMNAINNGHISRHSGGAVGGAMHSGGLFDGVGATLVAAAVGRTLADGILSQLTSSVESNLGSYGFAGAGKYAGTSMGGDQMANASIIMNVGRSMGASQRDLIVAIMTALQESSLRNISYGDRDSLGLFQQRPSQGWGTPQQIMDPAFAAHSFFKELLAIGGRNGFSSLGAEAQAVQRSAYPGAYDKWLAAAEAIVNGTPLQGGQPNTGGGGPDLVYPDRDGTPAYRGGWRNHLYPGIAQTVSRVLSQIPGGQVITSAWRSQAEQMQINPGSPNSDHVKGKAVDIGANAYDPAQSAMGDMVARAFAGQPGVNQILWKTMLGGNHFNHVHVGFGGYHNGGLVGASMPQLKVGGEIQYDNVVANLHRKETVLTAPLSQKLKDGINKIDSGMGTKYSVAIDLRGAFVSKEVDIKKAVYDAIDELENKTGRNRTVG